LVKPRFLFGGRFGDSPKADFAPIGRGQDDAAIATTYGKGKCFPGAYCHGVVDGSSLKSALCDSNATAECGRSLFKNFDDYAIYAEVDLERKAQALAHCSFKVGRPHRRRKDDPSLLAFLRSL
jgi:hypothetical protein